MKELEIITHYTSDGDLGARVYYNGEKIDGHTHSSEGWLLDDWGFLGKPAPYHDKTLYEAVKEPFTLIYKSTILYNKEVFRRTINASS